MLPVQRGSTRSNARTLRGQNSNGPIKMFNPFANNGLISSKKAITSISVWLKCVISYLSISKITLLYILPDFKFLKVDYVIWQFDFRPFTLVLVFAEHSFCLVST